MNIDERMKMLMENMKRLSSKHPQFTCGKFPPEWEKPLTEKEVAEYEKKNNIIFVNKYKIRRNSLNSWLSGDNDL